MSSIVHMQTGWWVQLCTCILHARLALRAVGFLYVLEIIIIKIIIKGQKDQHTKRVQGSHFAPQILTCKKKATQKGEYKMGSKRVPTSALQTQTCQKTYSGSNIVHPWWDRTSETSIWNNPCDDPIVHAHWSDDLKLATHTNYQKVALSRRCWWWQNTGNSKHIELVLHLETSLGHTPNELWRAPLQSVSLVYFSIALWYLWCKVQQTSPFSMTYRLIRAMGAQKSVF